MTVSPQPSAPTRTVWALDPAHTLVEFGVRHLMVATVKGRFNGVRGTIHLDEANPTGSRVEIEIDAASIDTRDPQRDAHLRSADFLDVERYPTITFRSTRIESLGGDRYRVYGDLTIRGVTRAVALDAIYTGRLKNPWGKEVIGFEATTSVNRHDFGASWNLALEAGGFLVGDTVKVSLEVEAIKQE